MVHYQPSAQVPARRGGRAAGPTPAAGASSSAGRAGARGRPAAFVGPPPRRAALAPVAAPRGERFSPPYLWASGGAGGRGGLAAAGRRRPAPLPAHPPLPGPVAAPGEPPAGAGHLPPGLLGLRGRGGGGCCGAQRGGGEGWWAFAGPREAKELPQTSLQSGFRPPVSGSAPTCPVSGVRWDTLTPPARPAGLLPSPPEQGSCIKVYYQETHNPPRLH